MKQSQQQLKERAFLNMLATSVFSMVLAMVFLASSTWAWFSTSLSSDAPTATIKTSSYHVESLEIEGLDHTVFTEGHKDIYRFHTTDINGDPVYTLPQGEYFVTIRAEGTGNGYCRISVTSGGTETVTFTKPIRAGKTYLFTVTLPDNDSTLEIVPVWGTYSGEATVIVTEKTAP